MEFIINHKDKGSRFSHERNINRTRKVWDGQQHNTFVGTTTEEVVSLQLLYVGHKLSVVIRFMRGEVSHLPPHVD
jgi:hypothetical protein